MGTFTFPDGKKYDGEWKDGRPHGFGTMHNPRFGLTYEGQWKNGKRHGTGTLTGISGFWKGEWENDLQKDTEWFYFPGYGEWDIRLTRHLFY